MATTTKKKSPAKKKPALKKSKKVNPWLIGLGAAAVAVIGVMVVTMSFAGSWPQSGCGVTRFDKHNPAPTLKQGSKGACVKVLQSGLKNTGFMKKSAATDGVFGSGTANSVYLLQSYYGLASKDKVVGNCTWYALYASNKFAGSNDRDQVRFVVAAQNRSCVK